MAQPRRKPDISTELLAVRLTPQEKQTLSDKAAQCQMQLPQFVRIVLEMSTPETVKQSIDNQAHT
jgi:hypothetical protein